MLQVVDADGPQWGHGARTEFSSWRGHAGIVPTGEPGAEQAAFEDAERFVGLLRSWRQGRPHWDFAAGEPRRPENEETLVETATAQMERALRVEGWLGYPPERAIILRELVGKLTVLQIECEECGRSGQYRLDRLRCAHRR